MSEAKIHERTVKTRTLQKPKSAAPENSLLGAIELGALCGGVRHPLVDSSSM